MHTHESQDEQVEIICIPDDDGHEEEFEVIMKFDVDETNQSYLMVVPANESDEDAEEVYAFRYELNGDEYTLYTIDDDEEWDMVEETFNTLMVDAEDDED